MTRAEYDLTLKTLAEHVGELLAENDPPTGERLERVTRLQALCEIIQGARDRDAPQAPAEKWVS